MRNVILGGALVFLSFVGGLSANAQSGPQEQLETRGLAIETQTGERYVFDVELALTPQQQQRGLMYRTTMPANSGMIFIFSQDRPASFWMKNTYLSLDIIFIRSDGIIANIARGTVPCSEESVPSDGPVRAVLELNAGTTQLLSIEAGDRIDFPLDDEAANSNERPEAPAPTARAC